MCAREPRKTTLTRRRTTTTTTTRAKQRTRRQAHGTFPLEIDREIVEIDALALALAHSDVAVKVRRLGDVGFHVGVVDEHERLEPIGQRLFGPRRQIAFDPVPLVDVATVFTDLHQPSLPDRRKTPPNRQQKTVDETVWNERFETKQGERMKLIKTIRNDNKATQIRWRATRTRRRSSTGSPSPILAMSMNACQPKTHSKQTRITNHLPHCPTHTEFYFCKWFQFKVILNCLFCFVLFCILVKMTFFFGSDLSQRAEEDRVGMRGWWSLVVALACSWLFVDRAEMTTKVFPVVFCSHAVLDLVVVE